MPRERREALRLAGGILLANLATPVAGLVDTLTAGALPGAAPLAAVGFGASLLSALFFLFGFLRMGTVGPTAQAHGRGDRLGVAVQLVRALVVAVPLGLALAALGPLLFELVVRLTPPPAGVEQPWRAYLAWRLAAAPASLAAQALFGWFLGLGEARAAFRLVAAGTLVNALLDPLLALALGLGTGGIGLATALADLAVVAGGLAMARRRIPWSRAVFVRALGDRRGLGALLRVHRDLFLRNLALQAAFVAFWLLHGRLGTVALAAQAVAMQLFTLGSHLLDAFAFAAEARVGRALGAGDRTALHRAIRVAFEHAGLAAVALAVAFWFGRAFWTRLVTDEPAVIAALERIAGAVALLPLVGMPAFVLDGVFAGAVRTEPLARSMLLALLLFLVCASLWSGPFGQLGLWTAFLVFLAARGALLGLELHRHGLAPPASGARMDAREPAVAGHASEHSGGVRMGKARTPRRSSSVADAARASSGFIGERGVGSRRRRTNSSCR